MWPNKIINKVIDYEFYIYTCNIQLVNSVLMKFLSMLLTYFDFFFAYNWIHVQCISVNIDRPRPPIPVSTN